MVAGALWCAWTGAFAVLSVTSAQQPPRPPGWTESTHGPTVPPDYDRLFGMNVVHELRITIPPDNFRRMQADLATLGPARGRGPLPDFGAPPGPGGASAGRGMIEGRAIDLIGRDPIYVAASVRHDGRVWTQVGLRYKGNSSLIAANASGNGKVPFRLHFDRYEDSVPKVRNQRFYGFQALTFSSNFSDDSQIREVLATEVFRDRGVPAPRAAFYRVFVDVGAGDEYWGLYSMIEDPADGAMLDAQFGGRGGNLYKPDGPGADWTAFTEEGFPKKTNTDEGDFGDIARAIAALHASHDDGVAWRTALEDAFDVDLFLRWLAVNTVIENWDAYGVMAHNYYLYGDPAQRGRLRWIPWDNNMAFGIGPGSPGGARGFGAPPGGPPPGFPARGGAGVMRLPGPGRGGPSGDVLHRQATGRWPLIQRLLADEVYAARYRDRLEQALGGLFAPEALAKRARELHALVAPSVVGERGERQTHTTIRSSDAFEQAVDRQDGLLEGIRRRAEAVRAALDESPRR